VLLNIVNVKISVYHKKIEYLKTDILNSPNHIFGVHKKARQPSVILYFHDFHDFVHSSLFQPFLRCLSRLANFSSSLLFDVDNNASECYNWIVNNICWGQKNRFFFKRFTGRLQRYC
jgi:hypothetical protein